MVRLRRVVVPGLPHHVTQRGNRRQRTFFSDEDCAEYQRLLSASCRAFGTQVWAFCLMPNHVHLIVVPADEFGLRDALAEAHRRYTRMIKLREGWRGHLWQERFQSFAMDERHLLAAARYVERNPVRARFCVKPRGLAVVECPGAELGLDHRLVHLAGGSEAPWRKALIYKSRAPLSLRSCWVLDQTMIKAQN